MRILQVIPSLAPETGGPAKAVLELSHALIEAGQEVEIFTTQEASKNRSALKSLDGEKDIRIHFFEREWPDWYFYSPSLKKGLEESLHRYHIVHIHGVWAYPTYIASRLCFQKKIPYLICPWGMLDKYCLSHHALRKKIYSLLVEKNNLNHAEAIHFSTELEKIRSKDFGLKFKTFVLPPGLNPQHYLNFAVPGQSREKRFLAKKKTIIFLGRLHFIKGLDLLMTAFAQVHSTEPDAQLVIVGPDEGMEDKLKYLAREKGIEKCTTFMGFKEREDKLSLLYDSDIFCLPSYRESFGLAALEAMAVGLPVVVSDQVGLQQEIERAQAGIVTACESKPLAQALLRLLNDEDLRRLMGENGRRLVLENYQWCNIAKQTVKIYEDIARCY